MDIIEKFINEHEGGEYEYDYSDSSEIRDDDAEDLAEMTEETREANLEPPPTPQQPTETEHQQIEETKKRREQ